MITGPSGAGKGTLIKELLQRLPELEVAISATTRLRRRGEEDGREYWFLTDAEFVRRVHEGDFLEHVTYVSGKRYGTLRSEVDRIAGEGKIPVLELETEGALNVKEDVPGAITIFITAPIPELERRLGIRVGSSVEHWRDGRSLVFDDTFEHEVWNDSDEDRVVLIFDIWRPELSEREKQELTALFSD